MKSNAHFEWIDILRGLSAIAVVLFHVRVDLWVGWAAIRTRPSEFSTFDHLASLLSVPLPFFGSAVMLFFLVSGFCVHYPYAAGARSLDLCSYSKRRFLRIYPPYFAVVILCILTEWGLRHYFNQNTSSASTVFKTVFMIQNYGPDAGQMTSNPSLWSLPVEVELYLVYPLFYWILMRCGIKRSLLVVALVSLGAMSLLLLNPPLRVYLTGNFAIYWIIWGLGAGLAELVKRNRLPQWGVGFYMLGVAALVLALAAYVFKVSALLQNWAWASFYFLLMLWGLTQKHPLHWMGAGTRNVLSRIGLMSYSLYLIHFPFFMFCGMLWVHTFGSKPANFLIPITFTLICLPIAYALHLWVEMPSHHLARKTSTRDVTTSVNLTVVNK